MLVTFIALIPKVRLDNVSSTCFPAGPIFTINAVLQLPPSASYKIRVNVDSRNGTNLDLGPDNAWIHLPKAVSE